jgi:hypothetical protein
MHHFHGNAGLFLLGVLVLVVAVLLSMRREEM